MSKQATTHVADAGQRPEARHQTPEAGRRAAREVAATRSAEADARGAVHGPAGKARHRPADKRVLTRTTEPGAPETRYRPMYARALRLRHLYPGGMLCFVYFEGAIALGLLLALAELVSWWVVLILPVSVALMVKVNDLVAGAVARSAARTPERERERVRREVIAFMPTAGHPTIGPERNEATAPAGSHPTIGRPTIGPERNEATASRGGHPAIGMERNEASAAPGGHERNVATVPPGDHPTVGPEWSEATVQPGVQHDTTGHLGGRDDTLGPGESGAVTALTEPTVQLPVAARRDKDVETTAQFPVVPPAEQEAGRRAETGGGYAAAGRYLDAAWRQHAYAMAHHVEHTDAPSQRERQSASRRYE